MLEPAVAGVHCSQCSCEFEWRFQLDHHVRAVHKAEAGLFKFGTVTVMERERFSCNHCLFNSYYKLGAYEHSRLTHTSGPSYEQTGKYKCKRCEFNTYCSLQLVKHVDSCTKSEHLYRKKHVVEWRECKQCPYTTRDVRNIKRHMALVHSIEDWDWSYCSECSYRTRYKADLKRHSAAVHRVSWYVCVKCSYKAKQKRSFDKHLLEHNGPGTDCTQCSHRFESRKSLLQHVKLRHAEGGDKIKCYKCKHCPYETDVKCNLASHVLKHVKSEEAVWYHCTKCSFRTKYERHLTARHMPKVHADHAAIKWKHCSKCSYRAKTKWELDRHLSRHATKQDGVLWYECDQCSFKAKSQENLASHKLLHDSKNGGWLTCLQCLYKTQKEGSLEAHVLAVHQSFDCPKCSYTTNRKFRIEQHLALHSEIEAAKARNSFRVL